VVSIKYRMFRANSFPSSQGKKIDESVSDLDLEERVPRTATGQIMWEGSVKKWLWHKARGGKKLESVWECKMTGRQNKTLGKAERQRLVRCGDETAAKE